MSRVTLYFSKSRLVGRGLVLLGAGLAAAALGYALGDPELARQARLLPPAGSDGARAVLLGGGVLLGALGLAAWGRALGDKAAATIRSEGIELRGLLLSRFIPWDALDRVYLRSRGPWAHIRAEVRRSSIANPVRHAVTSLSSGLPTALLDASPADTDRWIRDALAARYGAFAPRPEPDIPEPTALVRPPAHPTRIDLGRRAG